MPLPILLMVSLTAWAVEYAEVLSMGTLLAEADEAVQGEVVQTESEWAQDGLIYTRVELDAANSLFRWGDKRASFLVPGGRVGDVELTVPGSPQFAIGDDVLVFLTGDRLLGLGQGAFSVESGVAIRTLGATVDRASIRSVFGDPAGSRGCTREALLGAYEDGWSLRRSSMLRLSNEDSQVLEVTLLAGVEYSIQLCTDGLGEGSWVGIFDADEQILAQTEMDSGRKTLSLSVPETDTYWIVARNETVAGGWSTAMDVSIRFR